MVPGLPRLTHESPLKLLVGLAVALPILNPYVPGPSTQIGPLLVSWLCAAVLLACMRSDWVRPVVWGWLAGALLSSVIGLCQYFGLAHHFSPWMSGTEAGEAFANLRQRNQFATLTNIGAAALLWWLHDRWARHGRIARPVLAISVLALALLVAGNAASTSRIGFVQLVFLAGAVALWKSAARQRLLAMALAALALYVVAAWLLPVLLERFTGVAGGENAFSRIARQEGCWSRRALWSNVLHLITQKPWLGWGWGELDFAHYATLYPGERFCALLDNAHNLPLHLAVELGIPAAVAVCAGLIWLAVKAAPWRASDPAHRLAWLVLAFILLHSMVEYPLWYGPFQIAAALSVMFLLRRGHGAINPPRPSSQPTALRRLAAAMLAATVVFAGWDYHRVSQVYRTYEHRSAGYRDDTLAKIRSSWLFRRQVQFAELSITPLSVANAQYLASLARGLLHYSPEPRTIETLIEALVLTRQDDEALWHAARYRAAYPEEFEAWRERSGPGPALRP